MTTRKSANTPKTIKVAAPPVQLVRSHCVRSGVRKSFLDQRRNVWFVTAEYWDYDQDHDYRFTFEIEVENSEKLDIPFKGTAKELSAKRFQQAWAVGHKNNR